MPKDVATAAELALVVVLSISSSRYKKRRYKSYVIVEVITSYAIVGVVGGAKAVTDSAAITIINLVIVLLLDIASCGDYVIKLPTNSSSSSSSGGGGMLLFSAE